MERQYDLTHTDFNPTLLYAGKQKVVKAPGYHSHSDWTEITVVLSGKTCYRVQDETFMMEAGDILICNPGVMHQNILRVDEQPSVQFFTGFSDFHFKGYEPNIFPTRNGSYVLHLSAEAKREVQRLCYELQAENEASRPGKYFVLKAYLMQMLLIMVRETIECPRNVHNGYNFETYGKSYAVKRIINYMSENFEKKISLDQIAHNMYLSPVYVSKIFKEETGESPINYLIKIRLEKAKAILERGEGGSIKSIANEVGYEDVYHFSKLFKKYYGVSPLNYKKNYESQDIV